MTTLLLWLPYLVAAWLFGVGLYGLATSRNLVGCGLCLAVIQSSTYLLLSGAGFRNRGVAPVFVGIPVGTPAVDPVVQALMLTDVVVEATVLALILALAIQAHRRLGTVDPDQLGLLRG